MRYVTVLLKPTGKATFHPVEAEIAAEPSLTRECFHRTELLDDDTHVLLTEYRGDKDRYREIMDEADSIIDYTLSGGETWYAYVHIEPTEDIIEFWHRHRESELIIEMPVEIIDGRVYKVTYVGDESEFMTQLDDVPETADVEILSTGPYHPDVSQLLDQLTDRQREILEVAHERGYFQNPRGTTHRDIADEIGCSDATVGEHLRKVQQLVFAELLG
jgi:predicted DNA binding protein